jgi:hypothetical protein
MKEGIAVAIESDAQGDLALESEDAENIAGGTIKKAPKTQPPTPGHASGAKPEEPERSLEGLEFH